MEHDLSDVIAMTDSLRDRAEQALERLVASNPSDADALWKLGEIRRQKGSLDGALDCYRSLLRLVPDHQEAGCLRAILTGQPWSGSLLDPSPHPTRWVRVPNLLAESELAEIWKFVRRRTGDFSNSTIGAGDGTFDSKYRSSLLLSDAQVEEVATWFLPKIEAKLAECWAVLGIEPFEIAEREIQLTRHMDGAFFKLHRDQEDEDGVRTRRVTYVYYFHHEPKRFRGGDLLLYDEGAADEERAGLRFTRLSPLRNSVVFFASDCLHQVTPLECPTNEFEDGRFTVNGWLHD